MQKMKQKLTSGAEVENVAQPTTQSITIPISQPTIQPSVKPSVNPTDCADIQSATESAVQNEDEILSHAFLTIEEVAQLLRVSKRTVYNLIYKGTLHATRVSYHVSIIPKSDFFDMLERNSYSKTATVFQKRHNRKAKETETEGKSGLVGNQEEPNGEGIVTEQAKTKTEATSAPTKKPRKRAPRQLIQSSAFRQSVRDTFVDGKDYEQSQLYTMAEICRKYKCTYGWFYNVRMRYDIPCVKANKTKCFPVKEVDKAITTERERLGSDLAEHWYTCFDIMRIYGLGKTQVRRFAETHGVRIKKCGHCNHYLKADWEAARKKAEAISTSTKAKRE